MDSPRVIDNSTELSEGSSSRKSSLSKEEEKSPALSNNIDFTAYREVVKEEGPVDVFIFKHENDSSKDFKIEREVTEERGSYTVSWDCDISSLKHEISNFEVNQ